MLRSLNGQTDNQAVPPRGPGCLVPPCGTRHHWVLTPGQALHPDMCMGPTPPGLGVAGHGTLDWVKE